jgi:hypothetical protein
MGYTTKFKGRLLFNKAITSEELLLLLSFLGEDVPGVGWIDLRLTAGMDGLEWDGSEKTYDLPEKVNFLIAQMRNKYPDFGLSGSLLAQGEEVGDVWKLVVEDNFATTKNINIDG